MLNWNQVLTYVKGRLSLPSGFIEKSDVEIMDWIKLKSIPEYSQWYPDNEYTSVLTNNEYYQGPIRRGEYNFFDDENLPIFGIIDCFMPISDAIIAGHPITGVYNFSELKCWSLEVFKSKLFKSFTDWDYTFSFRPPNIIKVLPSDITNIGNFVVHYERQQPSDLRKIHASMQSQFLDLCYADIAIWIGGIRRMYAGTTTPFGEIPLGGDELVSDGKETRERLIEEWRDDTIPPVTLEVY